MKTASARVEFDATRGGLVELDPPTEAALERRPVTSVGITSGALPVIPPINFRLVGDRIVFRTGIGTKLDAATCSAIVAFELNRIEPLSHTGWSGSVTGLAVEINDPAELEEVTQAHIPHIPRWAPAGGDRLVAVSAQMVSGQRIVPGLRSRPEEDS